MPISLAWVGLIDWRKQLLKALPYIAAITAVLSLGWYIYHSGSKHGQAVVQSKWDQEKIAQQKELIKLKTEAAQKEQAHQIYSQRISDELATANEKYAATVATLRSDSTQRLRNSEQRAAYYERLSTAGTTQQQYLASHAAELDRSLEQGRQLVQELSATLRQRDAQNRALGQQILTDRALTGEKDGNDPTSTK